MSDQNEAKKDQLSTDDSGLTEDELREISEGVRESEVTVEPVSEVSATFPDDVSTDAPDSSTALEIEDDERPDPDPDELILTETAAAREVYFEDDEEFLRGDDRVIHSDTDIALFKQEEGVISWEISNLYKDNGKPRSQRALRSDPPILKISSSDGVSAEFLVTHHFAKNLGHLMTNVSRAYYGVSPTHEKKGTVQSRIKDSVSSIGKWISLHKIKSTIALVLIGFVLGSSFLL